jgi:hypothetical protein
VVGIVEIPESGTLAAFVGRDHAYVCARVVGDDAFVAFIGVGAAVPIVPPMVYVGVVATAAAAVCGNVGT